MEREKLKTILESLDGISNSEWSSLKSIIDCQFNSKAIKIRLDGSDLNKINELILRHYPSIRQSE